MQTIHHTDRRRRAAAHDQCRYRHDHPEAISEDHRAHRPRQDLFDDMRFDGGRHGKPRFRAEPAGLPQGEILVAGENFGCGSSREHAPWALLDFGIRCVIAPSFADIFYNNCFKNGILPMTLPQEESTC